MLATEMTATANTMHRTSDPIGMHRFAYPVVREISSRRTLPPRSAAVDEVLPALRRTRRIRAEARF